MKSWTRFWLGSFAAAGTVAAHGLAYLMLAPDPHVRSQLLAATGHQYWDVFAAVATGAVVAGMAGFLATQLDMRSAASRRFGFHYAAVRLGFLQCVVFVMLEAGERTLFAVDGHVADGRILMVGLVIQIMVALAIAGLLVGLTRAVGFFSQVPSQGRSRTPAPISFVCIEVVQSREILGSGGRTLRGPPAGLRFAL